MADEPVKDGACSRRDILSATAAACAGRLLLPKRAWAQVAAPPSETPDNRTDGGQLARPWWLERDPRESRVIEAHSERVVSANVPDAGQVREMLRRSVRALTGERSTKQAWQAVLGPAKRIVLKFNSVGADVLGTTGAVARQLVQHLVSAGYPAETIAVVEGPELLRYELKTRLVPRGWDGAIRVGSRTEPLAVYLLEADAVINIGLLKTHQIAGMSAGMKNLAYAVIKHPAHFHDGRCSPYVPQVIANKEVASRLRLTIVDALRPVIRRGPDATREDVVNYGCMLMGYDPVAVDQVALSLLEIERRRAGLSPDLNVAYLRAAGEMGLGRTHPADIDRVIVEGS